MESIADIDESNGDLPVPSASPIANANGEKQDNNDVKNRDEKDKQEMIESIEDNIKNEDEISKKKVALVVDSPGKASLVEDPPGKASLIRDMEEEKIPERVFTPPKARVSRSSARAHELSFMERQLAASDILHDGTNEDYEDSVHQALEKYIRQKASDNEHITSFVNKSKSKRKPMRDILEEFLEEEFPQKGEFPNDNALIQIGPLPFNQNRYGPGDWVELRGTDMRWHLQMVTRVIKKAPDDWDWSSNQNADKEPEWMFTYNAGLSRNIPEQDIRAPEAGLKILFGARPWIWQQWAMLKVEEKLRFKEGHQSDFMEMDIQKFATDLWIIWIEHESNKDFKELYYDERIGDFGRAELVNHILKPFHFIDRLSDQDDADLNFEGDENLNVFTYLSLTGSGVLIPIFVVFIQWVIPIVLFMTQITAEDPFCDDDKEENKKVLRSAKFMSFVIFSYYMVSLLPDAYTSMYNVAGANDSVSSKLQSIRRTLWLEGDDTFAQMIGYKLDNYMNSTFGSLLTAINIFVLAKTDEAMEIVLNAIAFDFIGKIDEDIAGSRWYDPNQRWIRQGAVQVVMQNTVKIKALSSWEEFSNHFHIDVSKLQEASDGDSSFLNNKKLARMDQKDIRFMNDQERIEFMCGEIAERTRNANALAEYKKQPAYFGIIENILKRWSPFRPAFELFKNHRTWSRWSKVLFMAPLPNLDELLVLNEDGEYVLNDEFGSMKSYLGNMVNDEGSRSIELAKHVWSVLSFTYLPLSLRSVWKSKNYKGFAFRLFDGILHWIFYALIIIFPLYFAYEYISTLRYLGTQHCDGWRTINATASKSSLNDSNATGTVQTRFLLF